MAIKAISSFLVYPGKNDKNPKDPRGVQLKLTGDLYQKLRFVFDKSDKECNVPIRFSVGPNGTQNNLVKDLIVYYIKKPSLENGQGLANRLRDLTTKKPGLGLFFIMTGEENNYHQILLSRFPADQGILAEEVRDSLQIEYIERIFMKNAATYKAAFYQGPSFDNDFWSGFVVDKQLDDPANYWINGFLLSEYISTSKYGTQRLAKALKEATQRTKSLEIKQEIVAAMILAKSYFGKSISIIQFVNQLGLTTGTQSVILESLPKNVINEVFILDREEFLQTAPLSSVELDTGAILTAPSDRFDECIKREHLTGPDNKYKYVAEGHIINEKIRGN